MTHWYKIKPLKGPCWDHEENRDRVMFTAEIQFAETEGDQPPTISDRITTIIRQVFYGGRIVVSWGLGTVDSNPQEIFEVFYSVLEDLTLTELTRHLQEGTPIPETMRHLNIPGREVAPGTLPANPANHNVNPNWQQLDLVELTPQSTA